MLRNFLSLILLLSLHATVPAQCLSGDCQTGNGRFQYTSGDVYEGMFKEGRREGRGVYTWKSGMRYEGDWLNDLRHGRGRQYFTSGSVYDGEWVNGIRRGQTRYVFADSSVYEGQWADSVREGYGKNRFANGDVYEGYYKANKRHGKGRFTTAAGDVQEGTYVDGSMNGPGIFQGANKDRYEGNFVNDLAEGEGKGTYHNGDSYEGTWKAGLPDGNGVKRYANGDVYTGSFKKGNAEGNGVMAYKDGRRYEGEWKENGWVNGKLNWSKDRWFEGRFQTGYPSYGKFYLDGALHYEGDFSGRHLSVYGKCWLTQQGLFARRTVLSQGAVLEIAYPSGDWYFGGVEEVYTSIGSYTPDDLKPNQGYRVSAKGLVEGGQWKGKDPVNLSYRRQLAPGAATRSYVKGLVYFLFGLQRESIAPFSEAIRLGVKQDSVYAYRGVAYKSNRFYDSALLDFNTLLKKQPANKEVWLQRADLRLWMKDTAAAIKEFSAYITKNPKDSLGWWYRGNVYFSQKLHEKAIADFSKVLSVARGSNDMVYLRRGLSYEALGKKEEACADWKKAAEAGNKDAQKKTKDCKAP